MEIINELETMEIHFVRETIASERAILILNILVDVEYPSSWMLPGGCNFLTPLLADHPLTRARYR